MTHVVVFTANLPPNNITTCKDIVEFLILPAVKSNEPLSPNNKAYRKLEELLTEIGNG